MISQLADRLSGSLLDSIIRNAQEERQLELIDNYLTTKGYVYVPSKDFNKPTDLPARFFRQLYRERAIDILFLWEETLYWCPLCRWWVTLYVLNLSCWKEKRHWRCCLSMLDDFEWLSYIELTLNNTNSIVANSYLILYSKKEIEHNFNDKNVRLQIWGILNNISKLDLMKCG